MRSDKKFPYSLKLKFSCQNQLEKFSGVHLHVRLTTVSCYSLFTSIEFKKYLFSKNKFFVNVQKNISLDLKKTFF